MLVAQAHTGVYIAYILLLHVHTCESICLLAYIYIYASTQTRACVDNAKEYCKRLCL